MSDDYRNLQYFFYAYALIVGAIGVLFAFLLTRVRKLSAEVEQMKQDQERRDAS